MPTVIGPYTADHVAAVRAFNRRIALVEAAREFQFPEDPVPELPPGEGVRLYQEYFLATEGGDVRGGFILRHQDFSFGERVCPVAHYRLPVSEGVANHAYAGVGIQMLRSALARQPLLFAIGMGSLDRPLPRMLKAIGWAMQPVPFYFHVVRARAFLENIRALRTGVRRVAARAAGVSGTGWAAIRLLQTARRGAPPGRFRFDAVPRFTGWADELWQRCAPRYALAAARDSASLNLLYPEADPRFVRLRVTAGGALAGWALLFDARLRGHRHFGDMRLGAIADCMAEPERAPEVIAAATAALRDRGVDLIVSNQSHAAWRAALARGGYLRAASNYIFAVSKQLRSLVEPFDARFGEIHVNRGDGDGLVNFA